MGLKGGNVKAERYAEDLERKIVLFEPVNWDQYEKPKDWELA